MADLFVQDISGGLGKIVDIYDYTDEKGAILFQAVVVLSTEFYDELVAHAVPIDLRALKALKASPLALDIYSWPLFG